jgi:hypothetical protein
VTPKSNVRRITPDTDSDGIHDTDIALASTRMAPSLYLHASPFNVARRGLGPEFLLPAERRSRCDPARTRANPRMRFR